MKKILLLVFFCAFLASFESKASSLYRIDDSAIEALFNVATPLVVDIASNAMAMNPLGTTAVMADKNVWIAVVLDFFLGAIAIHRVYLGGTPILILGYFFTFGGIFGLVPLIDLVVLVISNQDISKYVGNNKFFMW